MRRNVLKIWKIFLKKYETKSVRNAKNGLTMWKIVCKKCEKTSYVIEKMSVRSAKKMSVKNMKQSP